jgi:hypothetical protein
MIHIFSSARSGSTWLGKIFDSHPDVLYLHEPEIADRGLDLLPFWFDREPGDADIKAAKIYFSRLMSARSPRATGTRPFFAKHYRSGLAEGVRRALIYAAKGSERIGFARGSDRLYIPDLADRAKPVTTVIKSVSALGRAEVLIRAAEGAMRPILLIRHPCGYVGSMLRGEGIGVMAPLPGLGRLLDTRAARRLGADAAMVEAGDNVDKLAWNWLLGNAEAYPAIQAAGGVTVLYEKLASDALAGVSELFHQIGLSCAPETEAFLHRSATRDGSYYSVFRDPAEAAGRWRKEFGNEVVARVRAIVTRDPIGRLFFND